jgi:hypothetical protein
MATVSFADKLEKSGSIPIHFVRCKDTSGKDCFFFLMCPTQKIALLKAIKDGVFDIRNYGKVVASGFGRTPSEAVKKQLKNDYNFDADSITN